MWNNGIRFRWRLLGLAAAPALAFFYLSGSTPLGRRLMPLWMEIIRDVPYGPDAANRLDILRPRWAGGGPYPAAVVFHGGGWARGSREDVHYRICRRYVAQGFVAIAPDYRLGNIGTAAEDAGRAVSWLQRSASAMRIDPQRIVLTGESAGAHLALLAGFQSEGRIAGIVSVYGPTDLTVLAGRPAIRSTLGAADPVAEARALSPLTFVRRGLPPVLLLHGTADRTVPPDQSTVLRRALQAVGGDVSAVYIDGAAHGFLPAEEKRAYAAIFDFLGKQGLLGHR